MEYEYRLVDRDLAVDGVKRLLPDVVWKIANTELVEGIGLPEVQMICGGKATEGMTVKEVITVHNLKRAMQFMLANLDRPVIMMATSAPPSWWPTMFLSKITRRCWQSRLKSGKTFGTSW